MKSYRKRASSNVNSLNLDYGKLEDRNLLASIDVGVSLTGAIGGGSSSVHIAGAVSNDHVLQFANNRFAILNEADGSFVRSTNSRVFWSEAGMDLTNMPLNTQVAFTSSRWIAMAIDADDPNRIIIAVSDNSDPTSGWQSTHFFADLSGNTHLVDFDFSPYHELNHADSAIFVSTTQNQGATNQQLFALRLDELLAETPSASVIRYGKLGSLVFGESLELSRISGLKDSDGWLYSFEDLGTTLKQTRFSYDGTEISISNFDKGREIEVPFYEPAPAAMQPNGVLLHSPSPSESVSVASYENRTVVAHNVRGSFGNAAIRWYIFYGTSLRDSGLIEAPNVDVLNPSVSISEGGYLGTFSIAYTATGSDLFPSSAISMGHIMSTVVVEPMRIVQEGRANYNNPDADGINRLARTNANVTSQLGQYWSFSAYSSGTKAWATNVTEHRFIDLDFVFKSVSSSDFSTNFDFSSEFGATVLRSFDFEAGSGDNELFFGSYSPHESIATVDSFRVRGGDGDDNIRVWYTPETIGSVSIEGGRGDDFINFHTWGLEFSGLIDGGPGVDGVRTNYVEGIRHTIDAESFSSKEGSDSRLDYSGFEEYWMIGEVDIYTPEPGTEINAAHNSGALHTIHNPAAFIEISGYSGTFVTELTDEMNFTMRGGELLLEGTSSNDHLEVFDDHFIYNGGNPVEVRSEIEFFGRAGDDTVILHAESWGESYDREFSIEGGDGFDQYLIVGDDEANTVRLSSDFPILDEVEEVIIDLGLGDDDLYLGVSRHYVTGSQRIQVRDSGGDDVFSGVADVGTIEVDLGAGNDEYWVRVPNYADGEYASSATYKISDSQGTDSLNFRQFGTLETSEIRYEANEVFFADWRASFDGIDELTFDLLDNSQHRVFVLNSPVLAPLTEIYLGSGTSTVLANSAELQPDNELKIFGEEGDDVINIKTGFLASIEFSGGEGEDTVNVSLGDVAAGNIGMTSRDTEFLNIIGRDEVDNVVVRESRLISKSMDNQILRTIEFGSEDKAFFEDLYLDLKSGNDVTTVYSSPAASLSVDGRSGRDYFLVLDTQHGRDFVFDGGSGLDVFNVQQASANTFTTLRGHTQNDIFYIGSTQGADDGHLGFLSGRIDVDAGSGDDWLYINDNRATANFGYYVGNSFVGNQVTNSTPDERPEFKGIYYTSTLERLRLDATDNSNFFAVVPNMNTGITVDGRSPVLDEGATGVGDVLYVPGSGDGRSLVEFGRNNGIYSFTNGSKKIRYFSVETVTRPANDSANRSFVPNSDSNKDAEPSRNLAVIDLGGPNLGKLALAGEQLTTSIQDDTRGFVEQASDDLLLDEWIDQVSQELELN